MANAVKTENLFFGTVRNLFLWWVTLAWDLSVGNLKNSIDLKTFRWLSHRLWHSSLFKSIVGYYQTWFRILVEYSVPQYMHSPSFTQFFCSTPNHIALHSIEMWEESILTAGVFSPDVKHENWCNKDEAHDKNGHWSTRRLNKRFENNESEIMNNQQTFGTKWKERWTLWNLKYIGVPVVSYVIKLIVLVYYKNVKNQHKCIPANIW